MKRAVAAMVFTTAFAASASFEWPAVGDNPNPVIPAGETVEVTDVSTINAYTSVTIEEGATLQLNTATPPTVALKGTGTIEKNGSQTWNMTTQQTGFKGSYYIKAGVVTNEVGNTYVFGYGAASDGAVNIYVDGGTLVVICPGKAYNHVVFRWEKLHLAGTGVDGMGALVWNNAGSTSTSLLQNGLTLTDDATISLYSAYIWPHGLVNLNGHNLTLAGDMTGVIYYLGYIGKKIKGPGDLRIASPSGTKMRTFMIRPSSPSAIPGVDASFIAESDPLMRFVLEPYTEIELYIDASSGKMGEYLTPIPAPVHVDGGVARLTHTHRYTYPNHDFHGTQPVTWSGPITFSDAKSEIRVVNGGPYCDYKVTGYISGPGMLRAGGSTSSPTKGRIILANPTNRYTGCTRLYLDKDASFALPYTNAIPNYTVMTAWTGRVSLMFADADNNWTTNAIVKLANEAAWRDNAVLSFDGLGWTGEKTVNPAEWGLLSAITNPDATLGVEHGFDLAVTSAVPVTGLHRFAVMPGSTARFSGEDPIALGYLSDRGPTGDVSRIVFEDATDVTIVTNGISVGYGTPTHMTVKDSRIVAGSPEVFDSTKAIRVGCASGVGGAVEISGDSFISNRFIVGHASGSVGAVYQRGGTVFDISGPYHADPEVAAYPKIGNAGHGYWEATENAKLVFKCRPAVGLTTAGILHIDGGSAVSLQRNELSSTTQPWLYLSYKAPGTVYIKDGKLDLTDTYPVIGSGSSNWRATVTLDGPNARYLAPGGYNVGWSTGGGGHFYVNMNAGVFESDDIARRGIGKRTNPDIIYLNFNGGTFKSRDGTPFAELRTPTNNYWFAATVYAGGATIDTDTNKTTVKVPLKGATGNGVSAVPLPARLANGTFAAPPYVRIKGDGEGATAYAIFDSMTQKVTGVRVTSPGFDYTEAWAEFVYGSSVLVSNACTLAANTSGDFTKVGQYELIMSATNTWGGKTILKQGKLTSGVDHAFPATTTFVMAGGTLSMNGKTLSDDSTVPMKWGVDLDQVRESGTVTYSAAVTFPEGATLEVIGGDTLSDSDARSIVLLRMTGAVTGTPTITGVTDPRWSVEWANRTLRLKRFTGTTFTIR